MIENEVLLSILFFRLGRIFGLCRRGSLAVKVHARVELFGSDGAANDLGVRRSVCGDGRRGFLGDLAGEVLILFSIVKHLGVVRVGQDFGSIAEEDDAALVGADTKVLRFRVALIVISAATVIKVVVDTRASELS
jgi:hypothetical protein